MKTEIGIIVTCMSLFCIPFSFAGDGIIASKGNYYEANVTTMHRRKSDLPLVDFLRFRRDFSDDVLFTFKKVGFIPDWGGGDFNEDHCTRYDLAYFTGRLWRLMAETFGLGFRLKPAGPRLYNIDVCEWGQEDVRIAIRSGLFKYHGSKKWWRKPVSRGTFIKYLGKILGELKTFTPVLEFPLSFPPQENGVFPLAADPRYPLMEYIYKTGLNSYHVKGGRWDIRGWLSKRALAEAMDRLIFIMNGYSDPEKPEKPQGEYPVHRKW